MIDRFEGARSLRGAYADLDWAATAVGAPETWSPALRSAVALALNTRFAVTLFWGPEFVMIYNEAYAAMIGGKHPAALGSATVDVFPEIWDDIGPLMQSVLAGEGATWVEDSRLLMHRNDILEETYFTFSYSPVRGLAGEIEGVIDIATDTTAEVLNRRRLTVLRELGAALADAHTPRDLVVDAIAVLRGAKDDLVEVNLFVDGVPVFSGWTPALRTDLVDELTIESTSDGEVVWARVPSAFPDDAQAAMAVLLNPHRVLDTAYLDFIQLVRVALAQTAVRIRAGQIERDLNEAEHAMSEALQRSLLSEPAATATLELAVRYQPAAALAQIGGDWYDSFVLPDGALTVVVGDVAGHDRDAAAAMAQVRNLLRGVCATLQRPTSRVVSALDQAMDSLGVEVLASTFLAQLDPPDETGRHSVQWTNAGHPPPVLIDRSGGVRLLEDEPELMLGVRPYTPRSNHSVVLEPGATLVLYTDGLIERRGASLDDSFGRLLGVLRDGHEHTPDELCDHLLRQFADSVDDDIVLLVVRAKPTAT